MALNPGSPIFMIGSVGSGVTDMIPFSQLRWIDGAKASQTTSQLVAAPGAGKRIIVHTIIFSAVAVNILTLENGSGGTQVGPKIRVAADTTSQILCHKALSENTALFWDISAASQADVTVGYEITPIRQGGAG